MSTEWRIGQGYDIHAVVEERPLVLGGVEVRQSFGLGGHTDGDVVLHAVIDALFGAAGLPDIGEHFPSTDSALKGVSSRRLLRECMQKIEKDRWTVSNLDLTIVAEKPKLSAHKIRIAESLADMLGIDHQRVSAKAKTNEGFDAVGRGEAIACHVVLTLKRGTE